MTTISIQNNFPEVAAALRRVSFDVGNKAVTRALNTTIVQGQTQAAREISKEFRITSTKVRERLSIRRASARGSLRLEATLEAGRRGKGRSLNLIQFVENKVSLAEGRRRAKSGIASQVRFQIKRSGGKKVIKGAFIANQGRTVFIREGKSRLPIKALSTIDVPQMFNSRRINTTIRTVMIQRFGTNFNRELRAVLRGFAR